MNIVNLLLERGADATAEDRWGRNALDDALNGNGNQTERDEISAALQAKGAVAKVSERLGVVFGSDACIQLIAMSTRIKSTLEPGNAGSLLKESMTSKHMEVCWDDIQLLDRLGGGR